MSKKSKWATKLQLLVSLVDFLDSSELSDVSSDDL